MSASYHANALLSCKQMAVADKSAVAAGVPVVELMLNAGVAVAEAINQRWRPGRASVVCGPGNNGGDGFVVARLLQESGWTVRLALLGEVAHLPPAACHHAKRWSGSIESLDVSLLATDLVVDGLFGAGLTRPLQGQAAEWNEALAASGVPVCAIDIPSGVSGDTGLHEGVGLAAALTVTFFRKKPGHVLMPGRALCGELVLADIGIPVSVLANLGVQAFENHPDLWHQALPRTKITQHKYQRGHVLILGGRVLTGAARLSALAAARMGAGLVTVAAPTEAWPVYAASLLSVMVLPSDSAEAWSSLLEDTRRNVILVGPGAGAEVGSRALAALQTARAVVLDADALTAFTEYPSCLFEAIQGPCVLTPHEGEFNRLFPGDGDKLTRTRDAARKSGAVVIHKGADTVIAHPDGRAIINTSGHPALATAGTGDVLAGMVAGLLAQEMDPFLAAAGACWIHGRAGSLAGIGLIADDLPVLLPGLLQALTYTGPYKRS